MDIESERTLVWHLPLNSFGNQLHSIFHIALPVAVLASVSHGAKRTHAAIDLISSSLVENSLSGALLGAGKKAPDHNRMGAGSQRLGDVTRVLDPAIGDKRDVVALGGLGAACDRRELRHSDP